MLFTGKPSGSQTAVIADDSGVRVSYVPKGGVGCASAEPYEAFGVRRFVEPPRITRPGG